MSESNAPELPPPRLSKRPGPGTWLPQALGIVLPLVLVGTTILTLSIVLQSVREQETDALLIDLAARQSMFNQRYIKEVLLVAQGQSADFQRTWQLFMESSEALEKGGPIQVDLRTGQKEAIPPAPSEKMRRDIAYHRTMIKRQAEAASVFLELGLGHPDAESKLQFLRSQNWLLHEELNATVDDFEANSAEKISRAVRWSLATGGIMVLMGLALLGYTLSATRLNRKLVQGAEARRIALIELQAAKEQADAAHITRSQFLANMSHELRTPLNAIIGYSEILEEEAVDAGLDDFLPDLRKIHTAGTNLLAMINGILDMARIDAGRMESQREFFNVASLVRDVAASAQPFMEANGNQFQQTLPDDLGEVYGDQAHVRQVLSNLLSNAAKFTEKGMVTLEASREARADGEWLVFLVQDTGKGMSQEEIADIFEPFTQADASSTRKHGGTGIGLALSMKLCELMGAHLGAESEPGQGSTFTLELPVDPTTTQSKATASS